MESDEFIEVDHEIEGFVYLLLWHDARIVFGGFAEEEPEIAAARHLDALRQGGHENNEVQEVFDRHGEPEVETNHGKYRFANAKVNSRFPNYRPDPAAFLLVTAARKSYPRYTWLTAEGLNVEAVLAQPLENEA